MNKVIWPLRSGQITIPSEFRKALGIARNTPLQLTLTEGELRIKPVQVSERKEGSPWVKKLYQHFAPVRDEAAKFSEGEINTAIDEAVKAVRKSDDNSS